MDVHLKCYSCKYGHVGTVRYTTALVVPPMLKRIALQYKIKAVLGSRVIKWKDLNAINDYTNAILGISCMYHLYR